jgi:hypothetical protein
VSLPREVAGVEQVGSHILKVALVGYCTLYREDVVNLLPQTINLGGLNLRKNA